MRGLRRGKIVVRVDDQGASRTFPNGKVEAITWADVTSISMFTTDDGPFSDDVFWVLEGADSGCLIPIGDMPKEQQDRLLRLPDLDHEAFIEAMGSAVERRFPLWRKQP